MNPKLVIGDADVIISQVVMEDSNHLRVKKVSENLANDGVRVLYPVTAVLEAITVLQRKMDNSEGAKGTLKACMNGGLEVVEVGSEMLIGANRYFQEVRSKKNTVFDCIVAVMADRYDTRDIFSFDKFYKKHGFRLVTEGKTKE